MPNCRTCAPTCQRCHKKPGFQLPQECPVCGRYNPAHWDACLKCGTPIDHVQQEGQKAHLSADTKRLCFNCDPLTKPRCGECVRVGRIKICPECESYVLGTRDDCKQCGFMFEE